MIDSRAIGTNGHNNAEVGAGDLTVEQAAKLANMRVLLREMDSVLSKLI